jgi:L-alanine-DL-glutamate epimerase-like enolase superfamily enzyme
LTVVDGLEVHAFTVPTEEPESDGTLEWDATTLVLVEAEAGGKRGLGYTYGDTAIGTLISSRLRPEVLGHPVEDVQGAWAGMQRCVRNNGPFGLAQYAIAAVDVALWDLKARLLGVPLASLIGRFHRGVPCYASGGFTSYSVARLGEQAARWAEEGHRAVKLKVGRRPRDDPERVRIAREAIGAEVALFVDANGAYTPEGALAMAERFAEQRVEWLEEPVSSDDLEGLRLIRERAPAGMLVAAGEYVTREVEARRLLDADAVDALQADVTRCGGITGLLRIDALCKAHGLPFSAHGAPAISAHACCAMETVVHVEHFHDHVLVESQLFDGVPEPRDGMLVPEADTPGLGLELKVREAARHEG